MNEFNIGDRVICIVDYPDNNEDIQIGSTGMVCKVDPEEDSGDIGVRWDSEVSGGHECRGSCEHGHGWFVRPYQIELEATTDEPFEFDEKEFDRLFLA